MTVLAQVRQSLSSEEWRYVGAGALASAGLVFMALGIRERRNWPLGGILGDPDCDEEAYRAVLTQPGPSGQARLHGEGIHRAWLYAPAIIEAAQHFGVDPAVMMAIGHTESRFNPAAGSGAGAIGVMQIIPSTGRAYRKLLMDAGDWPFLELDLRDPQQAAWIAAAYISRSTRRRGSLQEALADYNCGGKKCPAGSDPASWPAETRRYIKSVPRRAGYYREVWNRCGSPVAI